MGGVFVGGARLGTWVEKNRCQVWASPGPDEKGTPRETCLNREEGFTGGEEKGNGPSKKMLTPTRGRSWGKPCRKRANCEGKIFRGEIPGRFGGVEGTIELSRGARKMCGTRKSKGEGPGESEGLFHQTRDAFATNGPERGRRGVGAWKKKATCAGETEKRREWADRQL